MSVTYDCVPCAIGSLVTLFHKGVVPKEKQGPALRAALPLSKTLLYLGDNAGKIVMDRILLETIRHPAVYFAVRGAPIINDATIDDAQAVGIDKIARIISNGDDAPGTILEAASPEFREVFDRADLVIAKGHGNFEGLYGIDKNIYYILMAKCDHVAAHLGVRKGDLVVATA
jgi:uncharacterized protein with ATP-grasp and redox domains